MWLSLLGPQTLLACWQTVQMEVPSFPLLCGTVALYFADPASACSRIQRACAHEHIGHQHVHTHVVGLGFVGVEAAQCVSLYVPCSVATAACMGAHVLFLNCTKVYLQTVSGDGGTGVAPG